MRRLDWLGGASQIQPLPHTQMAEGQTNLQVLTDGTGVMAQPETGTLPVELNNTAHFCVNSESCRMGKTPPFPKQKKPERFLLYTNHRENRLFCASICVRAVPRTSLLSAGSQQHQGLLSLGEAQAVLEPVPHATTPWSKGTDGLIWWQEVQGTLATAGTLLANFVAFV